MSIASCLGSLGNQANSNNQQKQANQQQTNNKQQTHSNSPTNSTIVMNNSSSLTNGLDLGSFTFGLNCNGGTNVSSSSNASSISPTENQSTNLNSVVGSGLINSSQLNSNGTATFTKCCLCNQQYGSPKVMPCCFRTYCLSCLEKLQQSHIIKCPGCKTDVTLGESGVSGLITDYSIIRILEQINEMNNGLTNGLNGTNNNLKELTCSMHCDESLRFYCKTCDQATCKECVAFQHQKHDNEYLIEASTKFVSIFFLKDHFLCLWSYSSKC